MAEYTIHCALTKRTFHLHWPKGLAPDWTRRNWYKLGEAIEREIGGEFNSFPGERSSRFEITSGKTDNALIDDLSQIIRAHLPDNTDTRTVYWNAVDEDTKWEEDP